MMLMIEGKHTFSLNHKIKLIDITYMKIEASMKYCIP